MNEQHKHENIQAEDHIKHCAADAAATGDNKVLNDLSLAIDKFMK